ncbi:MAG: DNA photolyase family protein [Bacteroidota bacterium]|nr:DNA photolyase family protein [Bacteroidota bacterium]
MALTIFWFRRDLRIFDNHGLFEALSGPNPVVPLFIFDKNILDKLVNKEDRRVQFIHNTLRDLHQALISIGSSLHIFYDLPLNAFDSLCNSLHIDQVITNHDYEPYALERDRLLAQQLAKRNIKFITYKDQVIYEKSEIVKPDGNPYTVFTPYSKRWKEKLTAEGIVKFASEKLLINFYKCKAEIIPTMKQLGFQEVDVDIPPRTPVVAVIQRYHETRNIPSINGTSKLSLHLRFGTVSIREFALLASQQNEQWLIELIWREFFMMILFHFPYVLHASFKRKYDQIPWRNNEREFEAWCKGETGYPIVDAGMRELNTTGFMHNRVRMITASFLTKHLLIDWRWGEAYFAEKLLDYELASNNGNWQWSAGCGCDAAPYFRIFNPTEQTRKFDPEFIYIKKWINDFHPNYIPAIVEHKFARKRALEVYKSALIEG